MINLSDIIQSAHGGEAVDTLSARFGLSPDQTQSALSAMMPALQMGLQNKLASGGLGLLLGHLGSAVHQQAFETPEGAQSGAATAQGGSVLAELFGSQALARVVQQVATESGVPASVIQSMLPVIASMLIGGLMHGAQGGGFGGMLSSVLGSLTGEQTAGAPAQTGGLGGILGNLFGGAAQATAAAAPGEPPAPAGAASGSGMLAEISNMIEAGTPASPAHQSALAGILGR